MAKNLSGRLDALEAAQVPLGDLCPGCRWPVRLMFKPDADVERFFCSCGHELDINAVVGPAKLIIGIDWNAI